MFKSFGVALHSLKTSAILVDCLSMIFLDTQSVNCSRPFLLCKACFPVITLLTFGFIVA